MRNAAAAATLTATLAMASNPAAADQGGISFWLPGSFGSLAATPLQPGWAMGAIYLHSAVSAGGDVAAPRGIRLPNRTVNLSVNVDADLKARADLGVLSPSYVFAAPCLVVSSPSTCWRSTAGSKPTLMPGSPAR